MLRNIRFQAVAQGFGALVNFALPSLVVYLGIGDTVTTYAVGTTLMVILRVVSDWGAGTLAIRDVARDQRRLRSYQPVQLRVRLIASAGCLLVMAAYGLTYADAHVRKVVAIFALTMMLETMAEGYRWVFRATQRMGWDAIVQISERTTTLAATLAAVFAFGSVEACALAATAGQVVSIAVAWTLSRRILAAAPEVPAPPDLPSYFLRLGPGFVAMAATWVLYFRIDYLILDKWFRGTVETGLYALAYMPLKGILMVPEVVMMSIFPAFAEMHGADAGRLGDTVRRAFRLLCGATLALSVALVLGHHPLSRLILLLKHKAEDTSMLPLLLSVLVLAAPLYTVTSICGHIMAATGGQVRLSFWYFIALAFNIAGNVAYAIPRHGALGCAVMTVATDAFLSTCLVWSLDPRIGRTLRLPAAALCLLQGALTLVVLDTLGRS